MVIAAFTFASCQTGATKEEQTAKTGSEEVKPGKKIKTQADSVSYALGVSLGEQLKEMRKTAGNDINVDMISAALNDVLNGRYTLTMEQANSFLQNYFTYVLPERSKAEGEKFLANVEKTNPNIKKTESGLLYDVIEQGSDVRATKLADKVKVMYRGELKDGTEFDSSYKRGEPAEFALNQVIKGWGEGLQLVGEGGKIKLWIPSDLGYGPQGWYGIGPNEPLVFEVELLEVIPTDQ